MNKILRYSLLAVLAIVGMGNAFAEKVTFTPTDFGSVSSADFSKTKDGVTVSVTASTVTADQIRIYKNQTITITCANGNITSVGFTCTANGSEKYGPGSFTNSGGTGEYTFEASGNKGTWSGNANSLTLTASVNQVRATSIIVTYSASSDTRTVTSIELGAYKTKFTCGKDGEKYTLPTATVKAGDATVDGASVTWTLDVSLWSEETQPTINNGEIAIPNHAYGELNLTASYAGNSIYKESSKKYKLTIYKGTTNISEFWEMFNNDSKKEALANGIPVSYWPVDVSGENFIFREELITYTNGSYTYLIDNNNKYSILFYKSGLGLKAGDKIKITGAEEENGIYGKLKTYKGLLELEVTDWGATIASSGNTVTPKIIDEAFLKDVSNKASEFLNSYLKIEGAKFVSADSKNLTFTVGETTLAVYNQFNVGSSTLEATATYTLTGIGSIYNTNYRTYLIEFTKTGEPTGINTMKVDSNADAPAYNLAGQKVADGFKGLVIKNGKKFMK